MKTRILTLFLLLISSTISAIDFQSGNLHFRTLTANSVKIIKSESYLTLADVVIPDEVTYNGTTYTVTNIERSAFENCSYMQNLTIGRNITTIDNGAFSGCFFLEENFINNSSLDAEGNNYWGAVLAERDLDGLMVKGTTVVGCRNHVTSITVPHYITSIKEEVFYPCKSLTSIEWNAKSCGALHWGGGMNELGALLPEYDPFATWTQGAIDENRHQITSIIFGDSVEHIPAYMCHIMKNLKSVSIPDNVKSIGAAAFSGCSGLTNVAIGNGVTSIGKKAFSNCQNLVSISMSKNVTAIGADAFASCGALAAITLPENLTSIGNGAFTDCLFARDNFINNSSLDAESNNYWGASLGDTEINGLLLNNDTIIDCRRFLSNVEIPSNARAIGEKAFSDCDMLKNIVIPDFVFQIGKNAFDECDSLVSVTMPKKLKTIEERLFAYCKQLQTVNLPEEAVIIGEWAFIGCEALASITIPYKMKSIENSAFYGCVALDSITIPGNVESIGEYAFYQCSNLSSITIHDGVKSIGTNAFAGTRFYNTAERENGVLYIDNYLIHADKYSLPSDYKVRDNTYAIADYGFSKCNNLASISLPESLKSIGNNAFWECKALVSVDIPASIEYIGKSAFKSCSYLLTVNLPTESRLETISESTFEYCNRLDSINLPNGLTSIGKNAFSKCYAITSLKLPDSVTDIGSYAFESCKELVTIELGKNLISIGNYAFYNCNKLESIVIPDNVAVMGWGAFSDCSGLKHITIGKSLTSLPKIEAFANCVYVTSIVWNAKTFEDMPRLNFSRITSFVFGDSVEHIPGGLCESMKNLTSITIPASVKSIGGGAFSYCSSLKEAHYDGKIEDWCRIRFTNATSNPNYYAKNLLIENKEVTEVTFPAETDTIYPGVFYGCSKLSSVKIPKTVKSIGGYAFDECKKLYDIYCYATEPPVAESNSFANYNACLHVPDESIRDYEMDVVFGSFKNIQALDSDATGLLDVGTEETEASIYDMQGRCIDESEISKSGIYIVNGKKQIQKK
ncbi:MAG: leucine-rich repeat domain-containing protein [Bacteroidales bacterium]|nr:leucine-rich repeat domain-containing protein [Bacteroidales bacterium]